MALHSSHRGLIQTAILPICVQRYSSSFSHKAAAPGLLELLEGASVAGGGAGIRTNYPQIKATTHLTELCCKIL